MSTSSDTNRWIRPWYPAGLIGHIYDDCSELLYWESEPKEGPGWLDPDGEKVCEDCRTRHYEESARTIAKQPAPQVERRVA